LVEEIGGEPVDPDAPRTVHFEEERVSGQVGVNRFTGVLIIDGDLLVLGPVAMTRMAGPPELMAASDVIAGALGLPIPFSLSMSEEPGD